MLQSILIALTAETTYPILGPLGRPAQAWFLKQITRSKPALAKRLHDEDGLKPYTTSTLLDEHGRPLQEGDWISAGQTCFLRITTLTDELSRMVKQRIVHQPLKNLTIHKMLFRVDGVCERRAEHPWADSISFVDLAQNASYDDANNSVRMEFISPTAFRSNGLDVSLPLPGQVFRSLWMKWNEFCPEPMQLHNLWPEFANTCILVSEMTTVHTAEWNFSEGTNRSSIGFLGTVEFTLPTKNQLPKEWRPYYEGASVVLQSLAHFAFYAGVGHHTTIGMGQARLAPSFRNSRFVLQQSDKKPARRYRGR